MTEHPAPEPTPDPPRPAAPRPSTPEEIADLPDDLGNRGERDSHAEEAADRGDEN